MPNMKNVFFFQFLPKSTENKSFLAPMTTFFVLDETLHFHVFHGANFKHENFFCQTLI